MSQKNLTFGNLDKIDKCIVVMESKQTNIKKYVK